MDMRRQGGNGQPCPHCRGVHGTATRQRPPAAQHSPHAHTQAAAPQKPKAPTFSRAYLSAYGNEFGVTPGDGWLALPLESQRMEGGFACQAGTAVIPADGYYMLLWEISITAAQAPAALRIGVNGSGTELAAPLCPGYDSGQQVTWFNQGDNVSLQASCGGENTPDIAGNSAQLTLLRLG